MDVILQEKVANLGNLGDKVSVKPGFGRNFLIPQGKAVLATPERIVEFEKRRAELEAAAAEQLTVAKKRAEAVEKLDIKITQQAGDEGKLFGSVGIVDVVAAVVAAGVEIEKNEVRMPEGAFRQTGEYEVVIHLHTDVNATLKVEVIGEA